VGWCVPLSSPSMQNGPLGVTGHVAAEAREAPNPNRTSATVADVTNVPVLTFRIALLLGLHPCETVRSCVLGQEEYKARPLCANVQIAMRAQSSDAVGHLSRLRTHNSRRKAVFDDAYGNGRITGMSD